MILSNVSLNAIQSVGRRAEELLTHVIGISYGFLAHSLDVLEKLYKLLNPKIWNKRWFCILVDLFFEAATACLFMLVSLCKMLVEILKTPILLLVSAGAWIYNGLVGYVRLFKNVGKDDILVADRYQDLGDGSKAQEQQSIIKKLALITVPDEPEKAQKVSSTKATLGYTFGFYDIKSKDEVERKKSPKLLTDNVEEDEEQDTEDTEYVVKLKSFPRRTGGYMIY